MPKQNLQPVSVPTTSLKVNLEAIDFKRLEERFELFIYKVPSNFKHSQDKAKYPKLHNAYKNQLEYPYYFYSFAKQPTIYILVDKNKVPKPLPTLKLDFLNSEVQASQMNLQSLCTLENLHILVKLFLSRWFYKTHRTCQSNSFYIFSSSNQTNTKNLMLRVELKTDPHDNTIFQIHNRATHFIKVNKTNIDFKYLNATSFYEEITAGTDVVYYRQVKTDRVRRQVKNPKDKIEFWQPADKYTRKNFKLKPARIKWFRDGENIKTCKSYLLYTFQAELVKFYNLVLGKKAVQAVERKMSQIKTTKYKASNKLDLKQLKVVGVYDNRFQKTEYRNQIPIGEYVDYLNANHSSQGVQFKYIQKDELEKYPSPVLVLQDYEKDIFAENGLLSYEIDPKTKLYEDFARKVPLQTLNINFNALPDHEEGKEQEQCQAYFNYTFISKKESEKAKHKINVCLNELFLKLYLIKRLPIVNHFGESLPLLQELSKLTTYCYMYDGYFMYVGEDNILKFITLKSKEGQRARKTYLKQKLNLQWKDIISKFKKVYEKENDEKDEDIIEWISKTHFIFAKQAWLMIENTAERILHKPGPEKTEHQKSQRSKEQITALYGIHYEIDNKLYAVGAAQPLRGTVENGVKLKKIHYYEAGGRIDISQLLQSSAVEFVRNKQYTVYPYLFDLVRLQAEIENY